MNILKRIWYAALGDFYHFPNTKHVIKYAFTSGGGKYYQHDDIFNTPYERGLEAIHAYEELTMKCDVAYLKEHNEAVHEILNGTKITMKEWNRLNQINDQLRQRLEWVVLPDHAYRLASVVFFDKSENPLKYELGYAQKKIEHWKQNDDIESFFLQKPVQTLIPFLRGFEGNFTTYSGVIEKVNAHHLNNLSTRFGAKVESEANGKQ